MGQQGRFVFRKSLNYSEFYSRQFLFNEIFRAVTRCSPAEFARLNVELMGNYVSGFNVNSISVAAQLYPVREGPNALDFYTSFNVELGIEKKYPRLAKFDIVKEYCLRYPGTAIVNSDVLSLDEWLDTEAYYYIKKPLDLHHSMMLIYPIPFQAERKFRINYWSSFSKIFDSAVKSEEVEFFSFPLYLAWLFLYGAIDRHTLSQWFELLVGMTPSRLLLLREMTTIGRYSHSVISRRLSLSEGVVRNYILQCYEAVSHMLPEPELQDANFSQVVDLVRIYDFVRLAGRPRLTGKVVPEFSAIVAGVTRGALAQDMDCLARLSRRPVGSPLLH